MRGWRCRAGRDGTQAALGRFPALALLGPLAPRGGAVVMGGGQAGVRGATRIVPVAGLQALADELDL